MAEEVDYESDSAMAMEEEEETPRKVTIAVKSEGARGSRRVEMTASGAGSAESKRRVVKGRGRGNAAMDTERYPEDKGVFEKLRDSAGSVRDHSSAIKSVEGWILIVTGVHEEAQEENLLDAFGEDAPVKNLHMNLDRRSGFVKGYALIEFEDYEAAKDAIERMDGEDILGSRIRVDWAFRKDGNKDGGRGRDSGRARGARR